MILEKSCIESTRPKDARTGYIYIGKEQYGEKYLHRYVYAVNQPVGFKFKPGEQVRHLCHNRACIEPTHLAIGTQKDNMQDSSKDGRLPTGLAPYNGKLSDENVKQLRREWRTCKYTAQELADKWNISKRYFFKIVHKDRRK